MKKLLLTWGIGMLCLFCSAQKISFSIEGDLVDIKSNATIWLGLVEPYELKGMAIKGDVKNGKFSIKGETFQPTIATLSLFLLDEQGKALLEYPFVPKLQFFLCSGKTGIAVSDSFKTISVKSSCPADQKRLESFDQEMSEHSKALTQLNVNLFNAMRKGDTSMYFNLSTKKKEIYSLIIPMFKSFIKKNSSSFLSPALLIDNMSIFNNSEIEEMYNSLSKGVKKSLIAEEIFRKIELAKNPVSKMLGTNMLDGELWDITGNKIKLSSFKGKFLLLDFWASWCGPCRKANPVLKGLYSKYGNTKLEFISVSIDTSRSKWLDAVKQDGMVWPQLMDDVEPGRTGWYGKLFTKYRGNSVPLNFLITPEGKIFEINPVKEELEKVFNSIYKIKTEN